MRSSSRNTVKAAFAGRDIYVAIVNAPYRSVVVGKASQVPMGLAWLADGRGGPSPEDVRVRLAHVYPSIGSRAVSPPLEASEMRSGNPMPASIDGIPVPALACAIDTLF